MHLTVPLTEIFVHNEVCISENTTNTIRKDKPRPHTHSIVFLERISCVLSPHSPLAVCPPWSHGTTSQGKISFEICVSLYRIPIKTSTVQGSEQHLMTFSAITRVFGALTLIFLILACEDRSLTPFWRVFAGPHSWRGASRQRDGLRVLLPWATSAWRPNLTSLIARVGKKTGPCGYPCLLLKRCVSLFRICV